MTGSRVCVLGLLVAVVGCGDSASQDIDSSIRDASVDTEGGLDGGLDGSVLGECFEQQSAAGELGGSCRGAELACNGDLGCLPETVLELGGPEDPIRDFPSGEDQTFETSLFPGDNCILAFTTDPGVCDADEQQACLDECGFCVPGFFSDADACLKQCVAEAASNSSCREGYQCDVLLEVCAPGCLSDADCLVFREDSNQNGVFDPYDPETMTGDQLVYDTTSSFFCNADTFRCEHLGVATAEAGIVCERDEDCEANGRCFVDDVSFPGSSCSKLRCDLPGNECAGDGICQVRGFGLPLCAARCRVGAGATPGEPSTYLDNNQDCREGYTCVWGGAAGDSTGACIAGVFNDVIEPNVGEACEQDAECYSPFGQGICFGDVGCSVLDCGVPGIPTQDVCGTSALCVAVDAANTVCLKTCASAADCLPSVACVPTDMDLESVCFPDCTLGQCRIGEECNQNTGLCVPTP